MAAQRLIDRFAGCGIAFALMFIAAQPVAASGVPTLVGDCVASPVSGSMTLGFGAGLTLSPLVPVSVMLSGTATCAGNPGVETVSISLNGSGPLSCEGGLASLSGSMTWSSGIPNGQFSVSASMVALPGTAELALTSATVDGSATLVWTGEAVATCPLQPTTSTPVSGDILFVSS